MKKCVSSSGNVWPHKCELWWGSDWGALYFYSCRLRFVAWDHRTKAKLHVAAHLSANMKHQTKWLIILSCATCLGSQTKSGIKTMEVKSQWIYKMQTQKVKTYFYFSYHNWCSQVLLVMENVLLTVCVVLAQRHEKRSLL